MRLLLCASFSEWCCGEIAWWADPRHAIRGRVSKYNITRWLVAAHTYEVIWEKAAHLRWGKVEPLGLLWLQIHQRVMLGNDQRNLNSVQAAGYHVVVRYMMFASPKRAIQVINTICRNHFYYHWRNVRWASKNFISTEEAGKNTSHFKMFLFPLEISEHYL